ncbi:hypothetical protein SSS_09207 [Sarcoptes scabiei]|nr:hypothetical protein SSS_09207 [Sarcoptes scabiei]
MSRYFRPPLADPFWDSFWSSERTFFDSHFGSTLSEEDFFPPVQYVIRRRPLGAPRSPLLGPHSPIQAQHAHPLDKAYLQQQQQQQQQQTMTTTQQQQQSGELLAQLNNPNNDKYQIMVDVSHFNPEEISVKMVDNAVVVSGKHEDKADTYGYVSRQFSRKYLLPADVEPEMVSSTLSADGILTIKVGLISKEISLDQFVDQIGTEKTVTN